MGKIIENISNIDSDILDEKTLSKLKNIANECGVRLENVFYAFSECRDFDKTEEIIRHARSKGW